MWSFRCCYMFMPFPKIVNRNTQKNITSRCTCIQKYNKRLLKNGQYLFRDILAKFILPVCCRSKLIITNYT